jgi:hypothetical protein
MINDSQQEWIDIAASFEPYQAKSLLEEYIQRFHQLMME